MDRYAALAVAGAFGLGSIPFGLIVGRLLFKSDIRNSGSGNIGAANALRTYGKWGGASVLLLDGLKGFVPAWLALSFFHASSWEAAALALAAVLGHCFSPWLRFRGGKGVATWLGAVAAISWPIALGFVVLWLAIVLPTRWASLGSLTSTALSAAALGSLTHDATTGAWAAGSAAVIFWQHRENIGRLVAGRENKISLGGASRV